VVAVVAENKYHQLYIRMPAGVSPISYPSNLSHRASYAYDPRIVLDYNKQYNNCSNTLCYTYSKNYIYKPHTAYGMVGTTGASYLARRHRL